MMTCFWRWLCVPGGGISRSGAGRVSGDRPPLVHPTHISLSGTVVCFLMVSTVHFSPPLPPPRVESTLYVILSVIHFTDSPLVT